MLKPFFDQYLKEGAPTAQTPPVLIYNTGENHWDRFERWPLACASGCASLYDRNAQTFVPNIFFAEPKDYVKAMQRVCRAGATASFIELPLVPATHRAAAPAAPSGQP